jgi:hypothetical protein
MSAAEVARFFARMHKERLGDEVDEELGGPPTRRRRRGPKPHGLVDRANLDRYLLMKRFQAHPGVKVFRLDVEDWPTERLDDFTTLTLAEAEAQRKLDTTERERTAGGWAVATMNAVAERAARRLDG